MSIWQNKKENNKNWIKNWVTDETCVNDVLSCVVYNHMAVVGNWEVWTWTGMRNHNVNEEASPTFQNPFPEELKKYTPKYRQLDLPHLLENA